MPNPKWFWYVARDDELMIDCDSEVLLAIALKRLERFRYRAKFVTVSNTLNHFHLIVRLPKPRPVIERQIWQLYFMDHIYRSINNLFRALDKIPAPCLLISPHRWNTGPNQDLEKPIKEIHLTKFCFWRDPDAWCYCEEKHKGPNFNGCGVGKSIRPFESRFNKVIKTNR